MERNGTEPSIVPREVSRDEFNDAIGPLMRLLGTDVTRVYDEPGIRVENGCVTLTLAGHVVTAAAARNVTLGATPEVAEEATEVRVVVRR